MVVLFATSEVVPWVKTGGLADVSAALPAALRAAGVDVRVLLPGYPAVVASAPTRPIATMAATAHFPACALLETRLPSGVEVLVIDCPSLYRRAGGPYQDEAGRDYADNALRFGLLSRMAAQLSRASSPLAWHPQVLHCNDWHAGLAPAYLHFTRPDDRRACTVASVHNIAFQGVFDAGEVERLELPPKSFHADGLEYYGRVSFLKAALRYADALTTVSPTYAEEIQHESLGFGMQGVLAARRAQLHGIVNGIDTDDWNPATDPHIAARYDRTTLSTKAANKSALQSKLGLALEPNTPLLGMISRLTHQKGIDLIVDAAPALLAQPVQLAVLGAGDRTIEAALGDLARARPGRVAVRVGYDESLARLIEAGADMFLMPSRFEPCGLNQMYSQRYGTPPVARATGGLVDTIVDATPATLAAGRATGFLFADATPAALVAAVERALAVFRRPADWRGLQEAGMAVDFGWARSARQYIAIYEGLI